MVAGLLMVCQAVLVVAGCYGLYQAVMAWPIVGRLTPLALESPVTHRFAVLVFAKDEAAVIGPLLDSLARQDYPSDAFEVFVTADNCTDATAAVARAHGATVLERSAPDLIGKGHALSWFFAHQSLEERFDACVMFDADNVADPGFLAAMNRQVAAGHPIATGYRMGKNPSSSWVAGTSTLFWLMQTRFFHLPRARRGLPCVSVGGTGFMFALKVLGGRGWHTESACEDIEFTLNAIAEGHFVAFAPDALFYDEQPRTFVQSLRQRYRWAVGSVQVLGLCGPRLLKRLRTDVAGTADALLYSLGVIIGGLTGIAWTVMLLVNAATTGAWQGLFGSLWVSALTGYLGLAAAGWLLLRLEGVAWRGSWRAVGMFPLYLLTWSMLQMLVIFYRDPTWVPIPHTDAVGIDDVAITASSGH